MSYLEESCRRSLLCLALLVTCSATQAQQEPLSDSERIRREADAPLRWIKLHSDASTPVAAKASASSPAAKSVTVKRTVSKPILASNVAVPTSAAQVATPASSSTSLPAVTLPSQAASQPLLATDELSPTKRVDPQWSTELMGALRRGRVEVRFTLAPNGRMTGADVVSSTDPRLDAAAVAAMLQWRFSPAGSTRSATAEFGFDLDRGAIAASDSELVAIDQVEPQWDPNLMGLLHKGSVRVRFQVDTVGRLMQAEVASASDPRLSEAALAAIRQWRFQPIDKARSATIDFGFDLDH